MKGNTNTTDLRVAEIEGKITDYQIKAIRKTFATRTTNGYGYAILEAPTTPTGYVLLTAKLHKADFAYAVGSMPEVQGDGMYLNGLANTTYNNIEIDYIYGLTGSLSTES